MKQNTIYESLFMYNTCATHQVHSIANLYVTLKKGFKPQALAIFRLLRHPRYKDLNWGIAKLRPPSYGLPRYAKT